MLVPMQINQGIFIVYNIFFISYNKALAKIIYYIYYLFYA